MASGATQANSDSSLKCWLFITWVPESSHPGPRALHLFLRMESGSLLTSQGSYSHLHAFAELGHSVNPWNMELLPRKVADAILVLKWQT